MTRKKTALITGANRGIGLEIARQLGRRDLTVLIGARNASGGSAAAAALAAEGLAAHFVPLDITDAASVGQAAATVRREFGVLDILVNNAAINSAEGQLPSAISAPLLQELMQANFMAHVAVTQAFLPLLRESPAGRIVNMSSSLGSVTVMNEPQHVNVRRNYLGYSASKAALNMFTVLLAKELKDTPIKVNSADPGWTQTDMGGKDARYTPGEGARVAVWLACLDESGPTGGFFEWQKVHPW
jgi:NAD(P)-dependent dehydrogenase (short-subunit alcohol dehydrogenase family)